MYGVNLDAFQILGDDMKFNETKSRAASERRLWRIFTPLISGVLAVVFVVIMSCYATDEVYSIPESCGVGFLVGYFSDTAIGKLSDIANVIFAR